MSQNNMRLKIMFIGDSGAGKTSLLYRWHEDNFSVNYLTTIGVQFKIKTYQVGKISAKIQLQDTAGQERFRSIPKPYYKNSHAICLCFSLSDKKSFNNLLHWLDQINNYNPQGQVYLVGCKSDLERMVTINQIFTFAKTQTLTYFQTSAKDNVGVDEAFRKIVKDAVHANVIKMSFNRKQQDAKVRVINEKSKFKNKRGCNGC